MHARIVGTCKLAAYLRSAFPGRRHLQRLCQPVPRRQSTSPGDQSARVPLSIIARRCLCRQCWCKLCMLNRAPTQLAWY